MTIDTSALRKFQELWGPVLQTIPAVLDAAEREADLDRAINLKRMELERVQADLAEKVAAAERRVQSLNGDAAAALERKQAVLKELSEAKAAAAKQAAEAATQRAAELEAAKAAAASVQEQLAGLQADYTAKRAAAEAEHAQALRAMEAEIAQLATKRANAEQALRDLKAKLG